MLIYFEWNDIANVFQYILQDNFLKPCFYCSHNIYYFMLEVKFIFLINKLVSYANETILHLHLYIVEIIVAPKLILVAHRALHITSQ
jgi:hypothetical protein